MERGRLVALLAVLAITTGIVGITANTPQVKQAWFAARTIKSVMDVPIILGGPHSRAQQPRRGDCRLPAGERRNAQGRMTHDSHKSALLRLSR